VAEGTRLLSEYGVHTPSRVRIPPSPLLRPETAYARSGDVHIAYQVFGEGDLDLVLVNGFTSHLELVWEHEPARRFLDARVSALAGPSEVLVSRTVKDLVAGSGIRFSDRGEHARKGIPDSWQLLAVD
jgi:hypothetical protein